MKKIFCQKVITIYRKSDLFYRRNYWRSLFLSMADYGCVTLTNVTITVHLPNILIPNNFEFFKFSNISRLYQLGEKVVIWKTF